MIEDFSYSELKKRGWQPWDKAKDGFVLMLCPLKDLKNVPDGVVFEAIDGERQYVKGLDEIDTDTRGGMLAFGVTIREDPEDPIAEAVKKVSAAVKEAKKKIGIGNEDLLAQARALREKYENLWDNKLKPNEVIKELAGNEKFYNKTMVTPEMAADY